MEALSGYASFGKFQLVARLGKGGMGDVYLALSRGMEGFKKLVVIKRLHETLVDDERARSMFLEEGRLAARLNHPNVVQTNEVGELDGALFLSMEYLEGQSLFQVARHWKANPNPRMVARIISDALAGLHYAHELCDFDGTPLKIIHRDLSPHNIFITYDGVVKLLDFGIAKAAVQSSHTEVGMFKGKIAYMAPEQFKECEIDRSVDIFVAGIVLWECLASQRLFKGDGAPQTLRALLEKPIPRVSTEVPGIDPTLDAIVARALDRDPANRYPSAQELRNALEGYLAGSGPPLRQEDVGAWVSKLFQDRRAWVREQVRLLTSAADETCSTHELPSLSLLRKESEVSSRSGVLAIPGKEDASEPSRRGSRSFFAAAVGGTLVAALGLAFYLGSARARSFVGPAPAGQDAPAQAAAAPAPAAPLAASPSGAAPVETAAVAVAPNAPAAPSPVPAAHAPRAAAPAPALPRHAAPEQPAPEPPPSPRAEAPPASTPVAAPAAPAPAATASAPPKRKFRTEL
jgi:serine/threonine-protein kinase